MPSELQTALSVALSILAAGSALALAIAAPACAPGLPVTIRCDDGRVLEAMLIDDGERAKTRDKGWFLAAVDGERQRFDKAECSAWRRAA